MSERLHLSSALVGLNRNYIWRQKILNSPMKELSFMQTHFDFVAGAHSGASDRLDDPHLEGCNEGDPAVR
jgi:hypothetical protein